MTQDQIFSIVRSLTIFVVGTGTGMGIIAATTGADIQTDVGHMIAGAKEFMLGAGPLVTAILATWGAKKAGLAAQIAAVHAATPAQLMQAVQTVAPVVLRDAVAKQPVVKTIVVTSQGVANASPSPKVTTDEATTQARPC